MPRVTSSPIRHVISATYTEEGCEPIPPFRPSDEEYGRGLQRFVPLCVDVVIIERRRQVFFLAFRTSKPWSNTFWTIGGGTTPNQTAATAAIKNFERETGVAISPNRLVLVAKNEYQFKDRAQSPQMGCQTATCLFAVELTQKELEAAAKGLDPAEYDKSLGLRSFNREQLIEADTHPALLHAYDALFPLPPE